MRRTVAVAALVAFIIAAGASLLVAQSEAERIPDAETIVGPPRGAPVSGDPLTRRTQEIASTIRCPVCQGLSIADSPSEMAQNMRAQVRALLARGYTTEQILAYFERSYGQFVLLKPKFQGVNSLVWLLPVAALVGGIAIVSMKLRSLSAANAGAGDEVPTSDVVPDVPVDPYLARVHKLVKGKSK